MSKRIAARLKSTVALAAIGGQLSLASPAAAFCGFYVAQADSKLFNKSSKVVLARDGDKTSITMASDYEGEPREFALVIPVPTFIEREQIGVVDMKTIDHLDAYTAPRLVEYYDEDPCLPPLAGMLPVAALASAPAAPAARTERYQGVTVEASYVVGEYDISILSAKESDALVNWLTDNGYKMPTGAEAVLGSYIKQKMRFFVAKVNLGRMQVLGNVYLRPLQVRYETSKFMLPLRLGTVNASGPQDLIIYALTKNGRVEASNYRTVKLPTGMDVPLYVKNEFRSFYKAMFDRSVEREDMRAIFVEYSWDMGWCDPCASQPLSNKELVELGARWIGDEQDLRYRIGITAKPYVTRMHVRYDAAHFPEDLAFLQTHDRENFQGRYVLRHPWQGKISCIAGEGYRRLLTLRHEQEAKNLADLTGWSPHDIAIRMKETDQ
jgi:hypothetical protein